MSSSSIRHYCSSPATIESNHRNSLDDFLLPNTNNTTPTVSQEMHDKTHVNTYCPAFLEDYDEFSQEARTRESTEDACCSMKGQPFCCPEFEKRVRTWVELHVPRMVNPESKKEAFFTTKKQTVLLFQRSSSIRITANEIEADDNNDSSDTSGSTSPKSDASDKSPNLPPISLNDIPSMSTPAPSSSTLIESFDKMGSSLLLRRRQSQVNSISAASKFLSGTQNSNRHRLSIFTSSVASNPVSVISEENN